ncbi:hypothetical protein HD806DRAFT_485602 [Xylariaceae sp. AK1471]|nr:hypothetical protein HD806DRAFT_485602 [Xylariaceae sp. AK1471]
MEKKQTTGPPQGRQKMNYACEACRVAKTKCQSGPQPGICKRCSEFKRECIFRTGPRTRRPKASLQVEADLANLPPPPGPSKTFSIDFDMPVTEDPSDDFEMLRQQHERFLEDLVLNDDDEDEQQIGGEEAVTASLVVTPNPSSHKTQTFSFNDMSSSPSVSMSGTSSSWTESSAAEIPKKLSKPMLNLGIKPQFNLDSASKLLVSFRGMLPHLPCLVLPDDADVRSLARKSPFVLLAILAVTSCSSSLQGHSLYDEEFRKVLGLKFVAGGERSLELLQGILIYCAWYPFHLRPKNKQSYQYLKMAVDIVHDLELEQEADIDLFTMAPEQRARKLDNIRAVLGCFYGISTLSSTWGKPSTLRYNPQLARCAEVLEQSSELEQDQLLVWLVRLQYIFEEFVEAQRNFNRGFRDDQSEMQRNLICAGLEAQFRDFKERMPEKYASTSSILLESLITEASALAPPIIRIPRKFNIKDFSETTTSDRLLCAAHKVRAILDHITSLTAREISGFCGADYGRFIIAVVLAYRLSFPLFGICRDYDVARGRKILDFGEVLRKLIDSPADDGVEEGGDASGAVREPKKKKSDTASALKVVLRSVKTKYEEKSAALEAMSAAAVATAAASQEWVGRDLRSTCPMLNGSLDQYIPLWAGQQGERPSASSSSYATSQTSSSGLMTDALSGLGEDPGATFAGPMGQMGLDMGMASFEDKPLMYHDLWATMTTGWAGDMGEVNMEDFGNTGYGEMLGP